MFEFQDEQNIAVQLPTGVVSHSKSDHLGRKVFDELQLGKGLMNRTFTYHKGEVTQAHLDNDKVVSNPETTLVKQIEFADGRTIQYEYDPEERITKVIDSVNGTYEYTYDVLGQLLTEKKNGTTINTMTYDGYGNIKTKNGISYVYDTTWKDKLTSYNGKTITYDAQGNPTNYMGTTLVWEKGRQLKQFGSNTYTYNNDGIRTSKTVGGVKHTYVLDGTNIVKETWGSNTLIPLYDLDGTVCGINYNGTAYYFYKNLQGDVISITDSTGATVARYTYDAWGKCTITSDTSGVSIATINPFRYRGYYYDEETSLYYLQSRYYSPEVGRFLNVDNVDTIENLNNSFFINLYSYCFNNPINNRDDSGNITAQIIARVILGGMLGFIIQLFCDLIESWYFTYVKKYTTPYQPKPGDYLASMLTWSLSFLNPVSEKVQIAIIFIPYVVKHLTRLLRNEFNFGTFIIDVVSATVAYIVTKCLKKAARNKISKTEKFLKNKKNAAERIAKKSQKINIKFSKLGVKFSFGITISNTVIQVIYDLLFD